MKSLFSYAAYSIPFAELKLLSPAILSARLDDFLIANSHHAGRIRFILEFANDSDWVRILKHIYNKYSITLDVIIAENCPIEVYDDKLWVKKIIIYQDIDSASSYDWSYEDMRYGIENSNYNFVKVLVKYLHNRYAQGVFRSMFMLYDPNELYEKFPEYVSTLGDLGVNKTDIEVEFDDMLYENEVNYLYELGAIPYI